MTENDTEMQFWSNGRYDVRPRRMVLARLGHVEQLYVEVAQGEWVHVDLPHWRYTQKSTVSQKQLEAAHDTIREYGTPKVTYEAGEGS